ncbi:D-amino acid aminotransferase [Thaumasiovibrio sp. DFM-14]|uniref:D-amino acid aminotransferase n=1 Tax=Thaumasiovibrio sp. DFM-14 TaxID=3384792 RepID=UPI0039A1EAEE
MERTVFLNGQYVPESQASISVFDRGFLFSDAVYEVTAVVNGQLVDVDVHMRRLNSSCNKLSLPLPYTQQELCDMHEELVTLNDLKEGCVYFQLSRGNQGDRDFLCDDIAPTIVAFTQPRALVQHPQAEDGIRVVTKDDIRWRRCDIKTTALLAACQAKEEAKKLNADDSWWVDDEGYIVEGSSSNVFIVNAQGRLVTRPVSNALLEGITRRSILQVAVAEKLDIEEREFTLDEVYQANEAFITSATTFVLPVIAVNGRTIGSGKPGEITALLRQCYITNASQPAAADDNDEVNG